MDNIIKVENLLEEQIRKLIDENEYIEFLVGINGDFDQCVSSSVLRIRKNHRDDNSALVLVLPYPTAEYLNNENYFHDYYTDVEISHAASVAHPKSAIQIRNREMADRAEEIEEEAYKKSAAIIVQALEEARRIKGENDV